MDKKKLLREQLTYFYNRVVTLSEKNPGLKVNPTTENMYLAYVKQMKTIFPENEEVKKLSEKIEHPFHYADLSNLVDQLFDLFRFLLKE